MGDHTSPNSVSDFLAYVGKVYAIATKYNTEVKNSSDVSTANRVAMEYLRHWKYGNWKWYLLLGSWDKDFVVYANKNGAPSYMEDYQDPWPERIKVDHVFAAMNGFWLFGKAALTTPPTTNEGDLAGWGGDWVGFYADWINSSYSWEQGEAFAQKYLGGTTDGYHFNLRPCIEDADGFNIANFLLSNPSVPLDQACNQYFNPPAGAQSSYKTRFQDFYDGRMGGTTESLVNIATYMITPVLDPKLLEAVNLIIAGDLSPASWVIQSLSVTPPDLTDLRSFAKGYDDVLQSLIAQEKAKS